MLRALLLVTFWRLALLTAVCLDRAMSAMALSGLRIEQPGRSYCAFSTERKSVQQ